MSDELVNSGFGEITESSLVWNLFTITRYFKGCGEKTFVWVQFCILPRMKKSMELFIPDFSVGNK